MAKSKSNQSAKPQAASNSKRKAPVSSDARPSPAKNAAPSAQLAISSEEIGHAAGEIWSLLNNDGEQTLAAIKKSVAVPADLILAGIGWLAREDKLEFTANARTVKISLR
jgi:hypothetical protein